MATFSTPSTRDPAKKVAHDIVANARLIYDSINARDLDRAVSVIAPNAELIDLPTAAIFRGPAGAREDIEHWIRAFPDASCEVTNLIASGDMVVVEFTGHGTHDGPLEGVGGTSLPATGKRAAIRFCESMQFVDGKVVRMRRYYDVLSLLGQLTGPEAALGLQRPSPAARTTETIVRKKNEGTPLWMLGGLYEIKASSKETNGEVSVVELTIPKGAMVPPHRHDCGETIYILEGQIRWHEGDDRAIELGAGDMIHFPRGTVEWGEVVQGASARALLVYTPGGMDEFFAEAAEPARARSVPPPSKIAPDVAKMTAIAGRHGLELIAPTRKN